MTIDLNGNLDDVETDESYGPMPIGDYYAIVTEAQEKNSQSSGNPMIELELTLSGNEKYDGKKFWHYIVFGMDHSLKSLKQTMTSLGMPTDNVTAVSASQFLDKRCRVHNKHEEYQGEMKDKIHYLKPYQSSSESPAAIEDELLPHKPVGADLDDSDIPF